MCDDDPKTKIIAIQICEPCLAGEGEMCHTPACALCRHRVDLPIDSDLYQVLPRWPSCEPTVLDTVEEIVKTYFSGPPEEPARDNVADAHDFLVSIKEALDFDIPKTSMDP